MRSSLTRNVYGRLLAFHGLSAPVSALSGSSRASHFRSDRPSRALVRQPSRRTFMNFFKKPPREVKDAGFEPGFGTFVDFRAKSVEGFKLPPREELVDAFRRFFDYKLLHKRSVNSTQAFCARLIIQHLQSNRSEEPALTLRDLQRALATLTVSQHRVKTDNQVQLATELYNELKGEVHSGSSLGKHDRYKELFSEDLERYITALGRNGASQKAVEVMSSFKDLELPSDPKLQEKVNKLRMFILKSLATDGNEDSLRNYAEELINAGFEYSPAFHNIMTTFYAGVDDREQELLGWFQKPIAGNKTPRPETYMSLIKFSSRTRREPDWLKKALQELCDSNPPKAWWDVILKWAVYQGKDIDHLKRMMDVMAQSNQHDESVRADLFTINGLITAAIENKNPLLAERMNGLASEMGLRPNATTYALLLEVRIAGQDVIGASSAFEDLINCTPLHAKSIRAINQYIKYLCNDASVDDNEVLDVLSRTERREVDLEPETVVALCSFFLKNDKSLEVVDTLGLHLKRFSMDERRVVRSSLMGYCLDKNISTKRAWDCYSLLRQFFPEMSQRERSKLMGCFFSRKRADMACYIFGHMRAHVNERMRPTLDTYVECLEGLGACPHSESLQMIHNMFKMDTLIQPNTRLYNAFMIAYTACGNPSKAFDFWQEISQSAEGPTYSSLNIVFRVCQVLPFGDEKAKVIWDKTQRLEIEVPQHVYTSYVCMMAGQGHLDEVKGLLASMQASYGRDPNGQALAEVFNALPNSALQEEYKEWVLLEFPEAWQWTKKHKMTPTAEGTNRIRFDVKLRA